jgi:class 3 adenylate cyclase/CheY-like chemotaxis protein
VSLPNDAAQDEPVSPADNTSTSGPRLLVVDDNEDNRYTLLLHLEIDGYRDVAVANDGESALELLRVRDFDLVLLDVMMPKLDGYEVLARLKAEGRLHKIPVIMISALNEIDSVVRCIEIGAVDYLPKPFNPVLLRARVTASLEKKRLLDEIATWNKTLEQRVSDQVAEIERVSRLKRFLSPQVAELLVSSGKDNILKSHRRDITVVFCDLRGFTAMTETAEPEEVMGVLAEYHACLGTLIHKHEGTLDKFAGDGLMVVFNDPLPCDQPAVSAVRMAIEMREGVEILAGEWRKYGHRLGFGIGIAHGYATIGRIGFEGRHDYSAIGTVVNLASRLCGEAQAGQILVDSKVFMAIKEEVEAQPVGELSLKGFHRPVAAYDVRALKAAHSET